jgi:tRNA A37 methylthiotransferase MiaB
MDPCKEAGPIHATNTQYNTVTSILNKMEQQLNQLTPEQRRALLMQAQQQANQQIMQDMVQRMVKTCFAKCAGTSVSGWWWQKAKECRGRNVVVLIDDSASRLT